MDLNALRRKPRMPSRKNTSAAGAGSSPLEVEEIRMEIATKRPVESLAPDQATTGQPRKLVKIAVRKHKSPSEFERRVLLPMLVKDLYTLSSKILMAQAAKQVALVSHGHHYQMTLLDRVQDAGHLVTLMGNRASHLEAEIAKLKMEGDLK
ncbi:hypothetical protein GW17_00014899 [Ensete ventricosum]|nr:hypothetical protein GW17_00014899 [Ensete ventricosum]